MDNYERELVEGMLELLRRLIGYADAKEDFTSIQRSKIRFVEDDPNVRPFAGTKKEPEPQGPGAERGIITFTEKEILSMPKEKRKYFRIDGIRVHWRRKTNGVFEVRCTINKVAYYGASTDLQIARQRFIEDLKRGPKEPTAPKLSKLPSSVGEYTVHFLETFKKPNVAPKTFANYENISRLHVIEKLGAETPIASITASDCQKILRDLRDAGKKRTAEEVNGLLAWIFDGAVSDKLITSSPMASVKIPKHRRNPGKSLPLEAMRTLLVPPESRYDYLIWLVAYTGMRPIEIKSAVFEDGFVTIMNAKGELDEEPTYRRIPLHSKLRPYVAEIKRWLNVNTDEISRHFRKKIKGYRFYDLRHTFTTYIQEGGANKSWVDYVTNHVAAQNVTDRVYTHWSDEFHSSQIELLKY